MQHLYVKSEKSANGLKYNFFQKPVRIIYA